MRQRPAGARGHPLRRRVGTPRPAILRPRPIRARTGSAAPRSTPSSSTAAPAPRPTRSRAAPALAPPAGREAALETLERFGREFLALLTAPTTVGVYRLAVGEASRSPELGR